MLRLYNYLTRKKETFRPLRKGRVGLYTCGPTVWNYAHIGNLRAYVFDDILRRAFVFAGYRVRHVMNLTDVDDRIIRESAAAGKTLKAFTEFYAQAFFKDIKKMNLLPAWEYPRATAHIPEMVRLIQVLLKKKLAYVADDGVYFDISAFKGYGKLSRLDRRSIKPGARVSVDSYSKDDVNDFALWKFKKGREPSWKTPFGEGRPGWHIECSAMAMKYLGTTLDIHAGGVDLIFPHHEDEIAQSQGATGKMFAKYFVENEHLMVDGKKMSKSLGNVYTLKDLEKRGFEPMDFKYFVLGAHYRKPLNFTWKALTAARYGRIGLLNSFEPVGRGPYRGGLKDENEALKVIAACQRQFRAAIGDDLNSSKALAILIELLHYANALHRRGFMTRRAAAIVRATALEFDRVLGLNLKKRRVILIPGAVLDLVKKRQALRRAGKWAGADRLRVRIKKLGFLVADTPNGPVVRLF